MVFEPNWVNAVFAGFAVLPDFAKVMKKVKQGVGCQLLLCWVRSIGGLPVWLFPSILLLLAGWVLKTRFFPQVRALSIR